MDNIRKLNIPGNNIKLTFSTVIILLTFWYVKTKILLFFLTYPKIRKGGNIFIYDYRFRSQRLFIFNLILTPIEVLRSRMMATTEGGALFHSRRVLSELGPFGFFRGAGVTTAKAFPVNAGGFALLYYTKGKLSVDEDVTS